MSTTVVVPELGENVDAVEVVKVLVEVGDRVEAEQALIEVETDKAAVEVPSTIAGTVTEVHVAAGDTLAAGDRIVTLEADEQAGTGDAPREKPEEEQPTDTGRPAVKAEGAADEPGGETGEEAEEAAAAGARPEREEPAAPGPDLSDHGSSADAREPSHALVPAAPSVRRFARELGVDIARVRGTGPRGRISADDVKAHAHEILTAAADSRGQSPVAAPDLPDFGVFGEVEAEPMSRVRRLTAEQMARASALVPQVTHHDLADITELEELRRAYRDRVAAAGGRLTMTAILVKVVASALKVFPNLNSSLDMTRHEIIRKHYVHVGVAVDTERGLLVPVIRDADHKSITTIAVELDDLASRARERKLGPDEMQGGTFSISNLGGIGGTGFSPIVNWPEVGILGVSRARLQTEWVDGEPRPRLMLPLSLSYDHRLVDGAEAARFVRWVAEGLERPLLLVL